MAVKRFPWTGVHRAHKATDKSLEGKKGKQMSAVSYAKMGDPQYAHNKQLPSHKRIFIPKDQGGYAPAHVQYMLMELCNKFKIKPPQMDYSKQNVVAQFIACTFSEKDIADADTQIQHFYEMQSSRRSKYGNRRQRPYMPPATASPSSFSTNTEVENVDTDVAPKAETTPVPKPKVDTDSAKQEKALANPDAYVLKKDYDDDVKTILTLYDGLNTGMRNSKTDISNAIDAINALSDKVSNLKNNAPTVIEIKRPDVPTPTNIGLQHKSFPLLIMACNAVLQSARHLNIMLVGPAATGKSHASEKISEAIFGSKYPFRACGQTLFPHEFMGYFHGDKYVRTQFRDAFEHGGIFVADEFDRYAAGATVALNNSLAGMQAAFPDKMVSRHPDFIFIACANTGGNGATMDYNTANKQDASTMNRFIKLDWQIDDAIEDHVAYNKDWLAIVRTVRRGLIQQNIKGVMITPRQTMDGQALISAGFTIEQAENACLRQGMDDNQWQRVRHGRRY